MNPSDRLTGTLHGADDDSRRSGHARIARRDFLGLVSVAGAVLSSGTAFKALAGVDDAPSGRPRRGVPIHFFSKPLDPFESGFMADTLAAAGVDGIEVTVRPQGKVLPERVESDLPAFVETVRASGLTVKMMVTALTRPDSPHAEPVIRTASEAGIEHYRLGYLDYDDHVGIRESLAKHNAALRELGALNRSAGIQAGYQNHAGRSVGAAVWDLPILLQDIPPGEISVQYDIRHAVAEGSASWVVGMRRVRPLIGSLAIKDFKWDLSSRRPRAVNVPLGEGVVNFDAYFELIEQLGVQAPITLHLEYPLLSESQQRLPLIEQQKVLVAGISRDVGFLRTQLLKHQISAP